MPNPRQELGFLLIRTLIPSIRSLALLAIALGVGYFFGQRWDETAGEPNGIWYGLIGGFVIWAVVLRPRRRTPRDFPSDYHKGEWSDGQGNASGDDEGGGDDGGDDD